MALPIIPIALGLAQYAPQIASFLGGGDKSAAVASKVASIAQSVSGTKTPAEALDAIRADAGLQQQFQLAVLAANTELDRLYLADVQDARKRDVAIMQAGRHNVRADIMVIAAAVGLVACLVSLIWFRQGLPGEAVGIISTVAGIFGACLRDAFQFEFGSSRGSKSKDELLSRQIGSSDGHR